MWFLSWCHMTCLYDQATRVSYNLDMVKWRHTIVSNKLIVCQSLLDVYPFKNWIWLTWIPLSDGTLASSQKAKLDKIKAWDNNPLKAYVFACCPTLQYIIQPEPGMRLWFQDHQVQLTPISWSMPSHSLFLHGYAMIHHDIPPCPCKSHFVHSYSLFACAEAEAGSRRFWSW